MTYVFEQNPTSNPPKVNNPQPVTTVNVNKGAPPPPWIAEKQSKPPPDKFYEEVKEPIFKKLIPLVLFIIFIGLFGLVIVKIGLPLLNKNKTTGSSSNKPIALTYWGLWEPEEVLSGILVDYKKVHPEVTINYVKQSYKDYRERLQSSLARNEGPDIFRYHHTWMPMLKKELAPVPAEIVQSLNINANYYPIVSENIKVGGQVYGIPLEFDALALFYNTKLFKTAGINPPTTWEELRKAAIKLTVKNDSGVIQIGGVALGTTNNIDNFSDILGLMMLQNGADLAKPTGSLAEDALRFYTIFTLTDKVWDKDLPVSTYAFATEKVAMILAPSWRAHEIWEINPNIEFKTLPVPQLPESKVAWATFWVEGVSSKSANGKAAWEFLNYLSSKENLTKLYGNASQVRKFGEPYPRIDMAADLEADAVVGAFIKQGSYAKSWYLCSRTFDNGINDRIIKYYEDAVNAVLQNQSVSETLVTAAKGVSQVLTQYTTQQQ